MDTNKILSANLLDLIFDNRNKDYGAYDLRKTYSRRVTKSLMITGGLVTLTCSSFVFANKFTPKEEKNMQVTVVTIDPIPEEKKDDPPPPPPPKEPEPQVQTIQNTQYVVAPNEEAPDPPPTQDDLALSKTSDITKEGTPYDGIVEPKDLDDRKGIFEEKKEPEPTGPYETVEIDAKFTGSWEKFLLRNLNPDVPIENGAPTGNYTVIVQFVVDVDGSISDIRALTNLGYGVEQEAIRVLRKATKWEPAFQNGRHVKAYRKQAITFQVTSD